MVRHTPAYDEAIRKARDERFWGQVDKSGECWIWQGCTAKDGYGRFCHDSPYGYAYSQAKGLVPKGYHLDHLCRNPACVNPAHLEAVTPRENIMRSTSPSALNARKTHCPKGHEYNERNTYHYNGGRYCRPCNNAATAQYKAKRAAALEAREVIRG